MDKRETIAVVGMVVMTVSCACSQGGHLVGAYGKSGRLTAAEDSLFRAVVLPHADLQLKPRKVSRQVVAGTNYRFECVDKKGRRTEVVVYQPLPYSGEEARVVSVDGKAYGR